MQAMPMFVVAVCLAYCIAIGAGHAMRKKAHLGVAIAAVATVLSSPLLIASSEVVLRAIAALIAGDLAFKIWDFHRHATMSETVPSILTYTKFLVPYPFLLVVFDEKQRRIRIDSPQTEIVRLLGALAVCSTGLALTFAVSRLPLAMNSFLWDHILKLSAFTVFLEGLSRFLYRIDRLLGFDTLPIVNYVVASQTVAEFWQRYNTRVHSWFMENVFLRMPFRRSPASAVATVFVVNGLLHELMFGIATSRFEGYQFLFFVIQIPAVLCSRRIRKITKHYGWPGTCATRGLTIVWIYSTSVLFFHGVNHIFPFYVAQHWLP